MQNVKYTHVAAKAVSLSELFEARFEQGFEGPSHFRIELSAPDGPSTGGGKLALQHIKLVPSDGATAIVIGSANTTRQTADIRTFETIAELYAQRFKGARIPIEATRYRELTQSLVHFFETMRMTVTFAALEEPLRVSDAQAPAAKTTAVAAMVGVVVALGILAVAYWFFFLRH